MLFQLRQEFFIVRASHVERQIYHTCLEVDILKNFVLRLLIHSFFLKVQFGQVFAACKLLRLINQLSHRVCLWVIETGIQDENYLVSAGISLASFEVAPDEKLHLFSLHETCRIEVKHLFGGFNEAVHLAAFGVKVEPCILLANDG